MEALVPDTSPILPGLKKGAVFGCMYCKGARPSPPYQEDVVRDVGPVARAVVVAVAVACLDRPPRPGEHREHSIAYGISHRPPTRRPTAVKMRKLMRSSSSEQSPTGREPAERQAHPSPMERRSGRGRKSRPEHPLRQGHARNMTRPRFVTETLGRWSDRHVV